nr:LexA family transcriptional regulator [uncultured Neokomagataea sp.]
MSGKNNDMSNLSVSAKNRQIEPAIQRLREAVKKSGTQKEVANRAGIPVSTFSEYLSGREMKLSVAARIADACGVSMEWLATGREPESVLPPNLQDVEAITEYETGKRLSMTDVIEFPRYDIKASAGHGAFAHTENAAGFIAIPRFMLPLHLQNAVEHTIGLSVTGDSMTPTLSDGDLILVNTKVQSLVSGSIYAIRNEDEILVKRLERHLTGDIEVKSDNPRYNPQVINAKIARRLWEDSEAPLRIIGRVVWRGGSAPM